MVKIFLYISINLKIKVISDFLSFWKDYCYNYKIYSYFCPPCLLTNNTNLSTIKVIHFHWHTLFPPSSSSSIYSPNIPQYINNCPQIFIPIHSRIYNKKKKSKIYFLFIINTHFLNNKYSHG